MIAGDRIRDNIFGERQGTVTELLPHVAYDGVRAVLVTWDDGTQEATWADELDVL